MAMAGGNQQLLGVPPPSGNASSVSPPLPANTSSSAASNSSSSLVVPTPGRQDTTATNASNIVDRNANDSSPPPPQGAVPVPPPAQAPDAPPPQPTATTPSSTPLPPPPSPSAATPPPPQPDPSPVVPPSSPFVSPPPPPSPVSPPPPPTNRTPPPSPNRTPPPSPPPSSPPPTPSPPPPSQEIAPPTYQVSPSPPPPPPQPVILSPPPPNAAVSPPPPPTAITSPSPSPRRRRPPPPLPPANSSAPTSNSPTPSLPLPTRPPPSITPPGRNQSTSTAPSPRHSDSSDSASSSTSSHSPSSGGNFPVAAVVGGTVAAVVTLALLGLTLVIVNTRKKKSSTSSPNSHYKPPPNTMAIKQGPPSPVGSPYGVLAYQGGLPESGGSKSWFSYEELKDITGGFSQEHLLGQGGFGFVYKGRLPDGRTVAIKQLKVGGGQGEREFRAEVEIISRVHHRHLVSLVGYCISENNRLLVYEYVPNRTLEYHLHAKDMPVMEWSKRLKIAIGSARGLAYLHEDCHPRIIHRDIKSANILLDDCFEAQVADFGLAKLTNDVNTHVSTRVMGTFGYMAPEYASSGKLTDRSDVFSFGVVLLELITGRKPVDESQPLGEESLVEWARPLLVHTLETGDWEELVDPRLENNFAKSEMMMMIEAAAACVRHNASKRPRMVQVVRALDGMRDLSDLSNGVKYGESTMFNSRQYSEEIRRFQRAAFESGEFSSDFGTSGEHERRISILSDENPNIP